MNWTLATTAAVALVCAIGWLQARLLYRGALRELKQVRVNMCRHQWFEWWLRNAAEMTRIDEARPDLLRFAYAAQLAPSFARFMSDLDAIAIDTTRPTRERGAAASFAEELRAERFPWDVLREDFPDRALHNRAALDYAYKQALVSWPEILAVSIPSDRPQPLKVQVD